MPYDPAALRALCRPTRLKFDEIGIRTLQSCEPCFWPSRGWIIAPDTDRTQDHACPSFPGDGICVARTARGAASGGSSLAHGVLIVGWRTEDIAGASSDKVRLARAFVLGAVTLRDAKVAILHGADLSGANLRGADLRGADLHGADLRGADLRGADLRGANLHGADLHLADLYGADLHGANLRRADLHGADLYGANLRRADLSGANLRRADLRGADLHGANLHGAYLAPTSLNALESAKQ